MLPDRLEAVPLVERDPGRIRLDGQGLAGMLVAGMIESFRAAGRRPGWRGLSARGLARWMAS